MEQHVVHTLQQVPLMLEVVEEELVLEEIMHAELKILDLAV
jgi:hypothetical protein